MKQLTIRRNAPCPCGSGKKTKHCCLHKLQEVKDAASRGIDPAAILTERLLGVLK